MFKTKREKELEEENKKLINLLNSTWMVIERANLDFKNGVVDNGVDEGYKKGWEMYHKTEQDCMPYLRFWND